jgi:hypothetical protein
VAFHSDDYASLTSGAERLKADYEIELAALALQAVRAEAPDLRREAADVLLEDFGLKQTLTILEGVPEIAEDHTAWFGNLVHGAIAPPMALVSQQD